MLDYRGLIKRLRAKESRDNRSLLDEAADAIETLLNGIYAYRQEAVRAKMELDATRKKLKSASREWVSVDERLPAIEEKIFFVVNGKSSIYKGEYIRSRKLFMHLDGTVIPCVFPIERVTHWMPQPEPPEVEK